MTEILRFLIEHLSFLYGPDRFRLVDSYTTESFGNALLVLASDDLRIRLIRDRGQLRAEFQSTSEEGERWYSIDVVRRLLTGEGPQSGLLSPDHARFLEQHIDEIERRFSREQIPATRERLRELERLRAKELFG